jgi:hypothetical protein
MGLLAFPLFALVFAPFVITYIASEHGPGAHPDPAAGLCTAGQRPCHTQRKEVQ